MEVLPDGLMQGVGVVGDPVLSRLGGDGVTASLQQHRSGWGMLPGCTEVPSRGAKVLAAGHQSYGVNGMGWAHRRKGTRSCEQP